MWILPLVGYIGMALGFAFLTLAIGEAFAHDLALGSQLD